MPAASGNSAYTEDYAKCVKLFSDDSDGKTRRNYSMCYDTKNYLARWIAYPMHSYYTSGSQSSTTFYQDPSFTNKEQVTDTYNEYSRGHQIAKAQRTVTRMARQQSNYYTNMTPQLQSLNGGKWNTLENKERGAWMCSDTLYVVTGCHFDNYNTKCTNDDGKSCPVPTHYFKVMLRTKSGSTGKRVQDCSASELICAGYWVEHGENSAVTPQLKSVAEIEQLTGFTFFVNVPNAPKSTADSFFDL